MGESERESRGKTTKGEERGENGREIGLKRERGGEEEREGVKE